MSQFMGVLVSILTILTQPVLLPAVTSGVMWVLNTYLGFVAKLPNAVKIIVTTAIPVALALVAQKVGIDVSSVGAAASGIIAAVIFKLGQTKEASK